VVFGTVDRRRRCTLHQQDFHAMCKRDLGAIVAAH
jgi:aspartyl/asparaginyl beta-hydroxylase (cupin superfamily)